MLGAEEFIEDTIEDLKQRITGKAIIACSGGVDSMVAAVLAHKAVGDRLLAVYVDNGLMRKGETDEVRGMFEATGINYDIVDASEEFFTALAGVSEPERKRKVIGEKFIRVFERKAKDFGAEFLVQGTIAPDWIESGDGVRDTIKSHHNVGGLPKDMGMTLVEPLRDLYKDEVRDIARMLGVVASERQPFPGPALAVRCLGEVTPESIAIVREACYIVEDEIRKAAAAGEMELPWQYFAVLLPSKSVGVQGDRRAYGRTIAIRAVSSIDGMTATYSRIPLQVLDRMSVRITNEMKDSVNRVVYDITNKPPATIEWERGPSVFTTVNHMAVA
ncbi:MAG: glutamine-hydrolyzing GMP synthase subunit GuaA [Candidatus Methanomethylophilaceae archaeon]|nr:glutamine-hydrolyzing GMP synthase subunit GuaA [Candidatus Methanomethylophilaceae archaeon]